MRRLTSVRLVNWYHFTHEVFPIDGSLLLMGDNGSGKSTVLDAVQLALVADLGEVRFNKAANENSRRGLYGYVRYKLGSEDETHPGQVHFGRGACTSYVILEFEDDADPTLRFSCGVVMEATESDTSVARSHFVVPGVRAEEVPALDGAMVRTAKEIRAIFRERFPHAKVYTEPSVYRDEVRHRLGPLPASFHRLLVKGLDFKPIGQVRQFVLDYLLDERSVDTASLQANIENYKQLEEKAKEAELRLGLLTAICTLGARIAQERRTAESHRYVSMRAEIERSELQIAAMDLKIEETRSRLQALAAEKRGAEPQIDALRRERDRVVARLHGNAAYQQIHTLERDLEDAKRAQAEATLADQEARRVLTIQRDALDVLTSEEARGLRRRRPELLEKDELIGVLDQPATLDRLRQTLDKEGRLAGRDLATWRRRIDGARDALGLSRARILDQAAVLKDEGDHLRREREQLEQGRQTYPVGVEALLHLLRAKLRGARPPQTVAELIEVPHERWRNAVEGYLNTRRFDVIVAPEDFPRALSLYERHKHAYPLPGRGEVFIHGAGLVDVERMRAAVPRREPRSLAEQVTTDDELARVFCDFVLGDVICCDDEQSLRRHRRAITDTVMVYQNFVARQTDPKTYGRHFIGQAARMRRLAEIDQRLGDLVTSLHVLDADSAWLKEAGSKCSSASGEASRLADLVRAAESMMHLEAQVGRLGRQLASINREEIAALQQELAAIDDEIAKRRQALDRLLTETGGLENVLATTVAQKESTQTGLFERHDAFKAAFGAVDAEQRAGWDKRYARERVERSPAEIRDTFERQHRTIATRVDNLVQGLVASKTDYVTKYALSLEVTGESYAEFAAEAELWESSRLPKYRERILRAKEEAIQQLAEDIIFRLRENLIFVRRQIDDLNRALKDVPFGSERYQFILEPAHSHRSFYDLVMEAGQFEEDSLFGANALAHADTRETLQGLFDRLVLAQSREVKSELESLADYREYFEYDLKIHHANGSFSLYSRVAGDKSGGETQTPFYIAVFAAMFRLYRQLSHDQRPTCGLLLLDEAFSKMDGPRISATLQFARSLGLQLVLATPKERSEIVAPEVETSLYIHKDPVRGVPAVLNFTKEFRLNEHAAPAREGGALDEASRDA